MTARATTVLLRVAAAAGAFIYAALAIGSGLDRLTNDRPELARHVPGAFAVNALAVTARARLATMPREAAAAAQRLVGRAPVEPDSTALLGAARLAMGDPAGADRAFRVAGELGWRVVMTQAYWRQQALEMGDYRVAAERLDALLRQRPDLLHDPLALAPFEASDDARAALVERLATRPTWLGFYAGQGDPVAAEALARRVPSLIALADRGVIVGCYVIAPAVRQLAAAGFKQQATSLQQRHCPAAR